MLGLPLYQKFLLILQMLALVALVFRLVQTGLYRIYPVFFYFLVSEAVQSIVLPWTTYGTTLYKNLFLITASAILCFYVLVVLELYSIVLRDLIGIASLARTYTKIAICAAVIISLMLLVLEKSPTSIVEQFVILERSIVSSLVLFVVLTTAFLVYYPIQLNRNVIVYSLGYAFYFLCTATTLLFGNMGVMNLYFVNNILLTVTALCLLFWVVFLNRKGEEKSVVFGHGWDRHDEARLLQQLQAINSSLLR